MSVPKSKNAKITYFEGHAANWVSNAAALGVDPALATDLQTKAGTARSAFTTQTTAKSTFQTAVGDCDIAVDEMAVVGAQVLTQIRAKAKVDGNGIYTLAGLPIPPVPGPVHDPHPALADHLQQLVLAERRARLGRVVRCDRRVAPDR